MNEQFSWKKFQFITEVQTAIINNATNLTLNPNAVEKRHIFSATVTLGLMDDAFYAAERIPANLSAHEAACQFVGYMCQNLRNDEAKLPHWFARS